MRLAEAQTAKRGEKMNNCTFLKGTHELFTMMGLPYGFLVVEDHTHVFVCQMARAKDMLAKAVEGGVLTSDQASDLEEVVTEVGLAADISAFYQKIRDFVLPEDYKSAHSFLLCDGCTQNPLPHGSIVADDGTVVERLPYIWRGIEFCDKQIESGEMHVLDGVAVLKAALSANVPLDEDDVRKRYDALPEETRLQFESKPPLVFSIVIPGVGRATLLDF